MKNSTKKMHYLKHISECLDENTQDQHTILADGHVGIYSNTNVSEDNHKELRVIVYDLEEIQNKLYQFKMDNRADQNNISYFENQILVRSEEISRLEKKLNKLGH